MAKSEIIGMLNLTLHPSEGGYFRRTYESELSFSAINGQRKLLTSIYYLLTDEHPTSYLHRNQSDILHYYHLGSPIQYVVVSSDGILREYIMGPDIANGELPQLLVKAGDWKASRLCSGEYGLISEAVSPGFVYEDNELASVKRITQLFPKLVDQLDTFIKVN